jgi:hypothetical protein
VLRANSFRPLTCCSSGTGPMARNCIDARSTLCHPGLWKMAYDIGVKSVCVPFSSPSPECHDSSSHKFHCSPTPDPQAAVGRKIPH